MSHEQSTNPQTARRDWRNDRRWCGLHPKIDDIICAAIITILGFGFIILLNALVPQPSFKPAGLYTYMHVQRAVIIFIIFVVLYWPFASLLIHLRHRCLDFQQMPAPRPKSRLGLSDIHHVRRTNNVNKSIIIPYVLLPPFLPSPPPHRLQSPVVTGVVG